MLKQYKIAYHILPAGKFNNTALQNLYDELTAKGAIDIVNALTIGATIEDLDIVDLQDYIDASTNSTIINVFEKLQCGSRNHLKSFVTGIENNASSYAPQYLTLEVYNSIISGNREQCN